MYASMKVCRSTRAFQFARILSLQCERIVWVVLHDNGTAHLTLVPKHGEVVANAYMKGVSLFADE